MELNIYISELINILPIKIGEKKPLSIILIHVITIEKKV
jgi:hypothetical protein